MKLTILHTKLVFMAILRKQMNTQWKKIWTKMQNFILSLDLPALALKNHKIQTGTKSNKIQIMNTSIIVFSLWTILEIPKYN